MKMLRWAAGVTRLDKVRNEYIRGSYKVTHITDKLTKGRLRWYGHVMRRGDDHAVRKALALPEHKEKENALLPRVGRRWPRILKTQI
ncbi:jg1627 [Pararge aegeria aegeria]|uniref:Jg1627 protein n=1 Tax=Pararge aegeria aegeria TaxID=348720 RepID=A0A8S4RF37_9NEOP|nr:jg1627 [Pararge aegeria aegeria]